MDNKRRERGWYPKTAAPGDRDAKRSRRGNEQSVAHPAPTGNCSIDKYLLLQFDFNEVTIYAI